MGVEVGASAAAPDRAAPPREGMVWVPGGTFRMGSDHHYPEEAPAHPVQGRRILDRPAPGDQPRSSRRFVRRPAT